MRQTSWAQRKKNTRPTSSIFGSGLLAVSMILITARFCLVVDPMVRDFPAELQSKQPHHIDSS